ncbi:MAG: outer membrane protein assembly factor BamA, partial [Nitrospinae bacterium]|nr:outer membrane protein assembly factor BamA [Nitrospinota bacterium]
MPLKSKFLIPLYLLFLLALITYNPHSAFSEEDFSIETVYKIRVVGNSRIPESTIIYYMESKEGDSFNKSTLSNDIKKLYKLDHFDNITIDVNKVKEGVELVVKVREKPSVNSVKISGNKSLPTGDIAKRVTIKKGMIFKNSLMMKNALQIKRYYLAEGYYFAEVEPSYKETIDGKVSIKFKINEGPKALVDEIKIVGNNSVPTEEITKYLRTRESGFFSIFTSAGVFKENDFKQDLKIVEAVLQNHGFLKAKVKDYKIDANRQEREINITIYVEEGPVYSVESVSIEGDSVYTKEELMSKLTLKAGDTYSRDLMGKDILTLTDLYAVKGYAFVDVIPDIKDDDATKKIKISYKINHGNRAYIGKINVIGNETTRDFVVRRELRFKEGEILDTIKLNQ